MHFSEESHVFTKQYCVCICGFTLYAGLMKRNQKLGWMVRWCSMEVNMSLKACPLCWRGCMSCLKVKHSGSITDGNLCPFHFQVFFITGQNYEFLGFGAIAEVSILLI